MSSHAELARELSPAARSFVQRLICADVTQVIIPTMPPDGPLDAFPLAPLMATDCDLVQRLPCAEFPHSVPRPS